jgi:hypothetical protein
MLIIASILVHHSLTTDKANDGDQPALELRNFGLKVDILDADRSSVQST